MSTLIAPPPSGVIPVSVAPESPSEQARAFESELESNLAETLPQLTEWQRGIATQQLSQTPSRLHGRLIAYLRNVADVEAFASSTVQPICDDDGVPTELETTAPKALLIPTLSYPSFRACLIDHMLRLLEEEWERLFTTCTTADGKRISKSERSAKGLNKSSLVYGEVTLHSFGEVLWGPHLASLKPGGVFVDLGSGTARGVLAASYLFPFSKLVGIEILEGLHQAAVEVTATYDSTVRRLLPANDVRQTQRMELHCGSFLDVDWQSDADLVFANSTCFDDALMDEIAIQGEKLREGTLVVTFTKALNSPYFRLIYSEQHPMSWGNATVNIMVKCTPTPEELEAANAIKAAAQAKTNRRQREF